MILLPDGIVNIVVNVAAGSEARGTTGLGSSVGDSNKCAREAIVDHGASDIARAHVRRDNGVGVLFAGYSGGLT